jgi:hypothetical protein
LLAHLARGAAAGLAGDVAAVAHLGRREGREFVLAPQVEDIRAADHQHLVVVGGDGLEVAVLAPHAGGGLGAVEDVAQQQHHAGPALVFLQRLQGAGQFVLDAEGLLVDQHRSGSKSAMALRIRLARRRTVSCSDRLSERAA